MPQSQHSQRSLFSLSTFVTTTKKTQKRQPSGTMEQYIYDTDNIPDHLIQGISPLKDERILKAQKAIAKVDKVFKECNDVAN
ncbi:uncharacterized protein LY89DRAFT_736525 [Mollisia scopiformis]|uniref:Uncharacterized protein n=1 Tax=Mollisia scopiformis TaxID=149040 RepID=A0A194X3U0_MOLSC|nr:uncharacterized protein LY89DRAFT_736525 [Mollisia scopiformis]KUJ14492.1 hypothetical protein LY89DRAFT_736525 [Mollisia scopiformis]